MGNDAGAFLRRLAQEFRPRASESVDVVLRRMRDELPELWECDDIAALALEDTAGHISAFLDALEYDLDAADFEAPADALEVARGFARSGVPISRLLRAYRLAHVGLLQELQTEAARLTDDWELLHAVTSSLIARAFEYVDRGAEDVVAAYEGERDRLVQRRLLVTNEASRRIGTTLDTARTAQELADAGSDGFADLVTVDLLDSVLREEDTYPPQETPVLRRIAQRPVPDGFPDASATGRTHTYPAGSEPARALATGQALLHRITATDVLPTWLPPGPAPGGLGFHSVLLVPLQARGNILGLAQFLRHRTGEPFNDDDLLLARDISARAAVHIDNARRYTHEHSVALTLQRSLLPQRAPSHGAIEAASRYLPGGSRAGVGGDWYDVIPLSGARVALVVGDVVGRGLHASTTMGRLRTAVRAFADIDLMPDELLTHLDDVVIRLQREEEPDEGVGEISATCLYAVYDPVSRVVSLASAGHLLPAVATPMPADEGDGYGYGAPDSYAVDFPDLPIGPPLGLGGLPFETAQFELPQGSMLTLYTDGLIKSRTRDVDAARAVLGDVLARAPRSPDEICDRLLDALLPTRTADDVALLVARTRALDPDHVATLDLPADPAAVAGARDFVTDRLAAWGLEELSFTTELIVSELVTNAIRYGKSPIQLRLILQDTLTCEVSDASSTAPHLRRARTFDEGGRGLLLVAQLAEHWGTRHGREGKVIWAEQLLPAERPTAASARTTAHSDRESANSPHLNGS
ncbi:SpoIIE family protein phosphatase [Streptomyces sp. V3I7]|uniref:ATP-binding SpoIIE family protein phosphatase n=1 Tax=Streptomyces sp. V3I7 TaxID=3042278 RepID=UPI002785479A|nr:SpoIIE family protein phosphatase [Streptomyces sp. V3I7]MDQ0994269.1 serine phosphatase RsbU (regulator of sigma subunit)/anti-sigma regulatory factor (Ser/Thr protein kinase) [Streptomyces sp. V3I7]